MSQPRVTDNDDGEITITLNGTELRGWVYVNDTERRAKMLMAREYVEGWCDAIKHCAKIADAQADDDDHGSAPWDNGAGSMGYRLACREIESAINKQLEE
jgi:hypothetical protein